MGLLVPTGLESGTYFGHISTYFGLILDYFGLGDEEKKNSFRSENLTSVIQPTTLSTGQYRP
jgi:hypothetical protein